MSASAASAAPAAAADGHSITKTHAAASEGTAASEAQETKEKDEKNRALIQERKTIVKHEKDRIREISKKIKKCIRDHKRMKRQEKIQKILEEVKGTRNISQYQISEEGESSSPNIKNKEGETVKTRQGIANVFAKFYEDLYEGDDDCTERGTDLRTEDDGKDPEQDNSIKEFAITEIQDAIDRLKKGRAKDSNGIRAEQLKNCSDDTKEKIRTIFNEIAQQDDFTPKSWRKIRIQVIYKKVTEKMQATTGQSVVCQYCTSCLPPYYTLGSLLLYTKFNLPTKRGFGPITDVTITSWCTGCWNSAVASGVYRCTSARSTSRKHLIESNIQRYGAPCSSTASSPHL